MASDEQLCTEAEQLQNAGQMINALVWMVAAVVMAFSAITGAELLAAHGVDWRLGLAGGLAVDAALVVALIGDRQLHRYGQRAPWGTALRWVTAGMSLVLNCGQSVGKHDWGAAGLHAIFPVLLIVLTEASQGYQLAFSRAAQRAQTTREYPTAPVPGTASTPVPSTPEPAGTPRSRSTGSAAPDRRTPSAKSTSRPKNTSGAHRRTAKPITGNWDEQLWFRAVDLVKRHQQEHGRPPTLAEFHTGLRMSRNTASPLRNAVLEVLATPASTAGPSSGEQTRTGEDATGTDSDTDTRVVQLHPVGTEAADTATGH